MVSNASCSPPLILKVPPWSFPLEPILSSVDVSSHHGVLVLPAQYARLGYQPGNARVVLFMVPRSLKLPT